MISTQNLFSHGRPMMAKVVVVACFGFLLSSCHGGLSGIGNRPVVRVNNSILRADEFSNLLASRLKAFDSLAAKDTNVVTQAKNSIVQDFIVTSVTQDWAQKNQVFVHKEMLDAEIERIRKSYPDDVAFRKALASESLDYDLWESRLKNSLLEKQVLVELRKTLKPPTSEEIANYYQTNRNLFVQAGATRLRQIVLRTESQALLIKKELSSGKSFSELAKKYSITPEGSNGGDLGWIEKGTFDLFDLASKLGVGARTQPLKSPFGYHIIEVTAHRPSKVVTLEESRERLSKAVMAKHEQEAYSHWLEEQILQARVFKDEEFLRKIYVQNRGKK